MCAFGRRYISQKASARDAATQCRSYNNKYNGEPDSNEFARGKHIARREAVMEQNQAEETSGR